MPRPLPGVWLAVPQPFGLTPGRETTRSFPRSDYWLFLTDQVSGLLSCRIAHRPGYGLSASRLATTSPASDLSGLGLPAAYSVRLSVHRADLQPLPASSVYRVTLAGQGVFPARRGGIEPPHMPLTA